MIMQILGILAFIVLLPFIMLLRWATDTRCKKCKSGEYVDYGDKWFCSNCDHRMGDPIREGVKI